MFDLASQDFANVTVYRRKSVDGDDAECWCVGGKMHARILTDETSWRRRHRRAYDGRAYDDRRAYDVGPCDGSCTAAMDVRELLKELPRLWQRRDGTARKTPVHLDKGIRILLRGDTPLAAVPFADSYGKRDSERSDLCLDRRIHVKIHTVFAWAFGRDVGFTHSVRSVPCDGSCKPVANVDRQVIESILREIRKMRRCQGEADQSVS